jgi:hypothetical protein
MGLGFRGNAMPLFAIALATLPTAQADLSPPLPPSGAGTQVPAGACSVLVLSGIPPQPLVDWDCLGWTAEGLLGGLGQAVQCDPVVTAAGSGGDCTWVDAWPDWSQAIPASSAACSFLGLSGIPPQPVINWDCFIIPHLLSVRG